MPSNCPLSSQRSVAVTAKAAAIAIVAVEVAAAATAVVVVAVAAAVVEARTSSLPVQYQWPRRYKRYVVEIVK